MNGPNRTPSRSPSSSPRESRPNGSDTDEMEIGAADTSNQHDTTPELRRTEHMVTPEPTIESHPANQVTPSTRRPFSMSGYHSDSNDGAGPSGLPSIYQRRFTRRDRFRVFRRHQTSSSSESASTASPEKSVKSSASTTQIPCDFEMEIDDLESMSVSTPRPPVLRTGSKRTSDVGELAHPKAKHSRQDLSSTSIPTQQVVLRNDLPETSGQSGQAAFTSGQVPINTSEVGGSSTTRSENMNTRRRAIARRRGTTQENVNLMETDNKGDDIPDEQSSDPHCRRDGHEDESSRK